MQSNVQRRMSALQVVLLVVLLGSWSAAQATEWGFHLIGHPSVERDDDPFHETLLMTGAGTFDPDQGTAAGGGAFTTLNAFDDAALGGPTFHGTWKVLEFLSWEPEDSEATPGPQGGTLQVKLLMVFTAGVTPENKGFTLGGPDLPVTLTITGDGINVNFFDVEVFATNPTGLAAFHRTKP